MSSEVKISKRLVAVNSISFAVTRLVNMSVVVWMYQYLLSHLSPEEYSIYPVVLSVMVFVPLLSIPLTSGLGRYIVEAYAKGDNKGVTQIVSTMFPVLLVASFVLLVLGWTFSWNIGRILTIPSHRLLEARLMMGLLMTSASIRVALAPFNTGLYVRQKFVLQNGIRLCTELLRLVLLLVLLLGVSTRVLWVVVSSVSANVLGFMVQVFISRRLVPALRFRLSEMRLTLVKKLTTFGGWHTVLNAADMIRTGADVIILNILGTPVDVTNFHLGSMPFRQIQTMSYVVRRPLHPPLTAMHAMGQPKRLHNTYLRGGKYALWASLFFAAPLIIFRKEVMTLYVGEQFAVAGTVMALLLAAFPIAYGNVMMSHIAHAKAMIKPWAIRATVIHTTNLFLTLFLVGILRMGAIGSALATLSVFVVFEPLLYWPLGLRLAGAKFNEWFKQTLIPGFSPVLFALPFWMGLHLIVRPSTWLELGVCVLAGMFCFVVFLFMFCLTGYERTVLREAGSEIFSLFKTSPSTA